MTTEELEQLKEICSDLEAIDKEAEPCSIGSMTIDELSFFSCPFENKLKPIDTAVERLKDFIMDAERDERARIREARKC